MQHVDDGILQAWLDAGRAGLSAVERGEIERHLAVCAACALRAEEAEALEKRARSLLSPPHAGDDAIPPFEAVLARAGRGRAGAQVGGGPRRARMVVGWAATIALALGIGWWASQLSRGGGDRRVAMEAPAANSPAAAERRAQAADAPARTTDRTEAPYVRLQEVDAPPAPANRTKAPESRAQMANVPAGMADRTKGPDSSGGSERPQGALAALASGDMRAKLAETAPVARPIIKEAKPLAAVLSPVVVRGRVTDESGRPLAAAQVVVKGTSVGALTDAHGNFSFALGALPADSATRNVTVTAYQLGYAAASRSLAVSSGSEAFAELRLAPAKIALNAIVVTEAASAAGAPAAARAEAVAPAKHEGAWAPATRADAEQRAGFRLLTVPDLAVVRIELRDTAGARVVRVTQRLAGDRLLELVESREPTQRARPALAAGRAGAVTRRGDVYVFAAAPVSDEALAALIARLR